MGTVVPCKGIRIQESGIQLKEYEIPPTIEIQNPESRIPVPLTAKTGDQLPGIRNPHCGIKSPRTVLDQTRTQSLLYMRCDLWERFSEFAVPSREGRKKNAKFLSLFLPPSQARQISVPHSFARINKWRLGTSLVLNFLTRGVNFA